VVLMGSQRLDFRPASCDIYARPGSDLTFTVLVTGTGLQSAPTVSCDVGGQTPSTTVALNTTYDTVLVTVALTDTQTTALGSTGTSWSLSFVSGSTTTPILTGSYVGGTAGNTSQGMQVAVALRSGSINVQVLAAGGGGGGGGASALEDLSDVTITAAASGDILRHNGTAWVDTPGTTHFEAAGAVSTHSADTTSVHGIADTSALVTTSSAPELIRDTIGTALVEGANVDITVNDAGDSITIAALQSDPLTTVATSGASQSISVASYGVVDLTLTANCALTLTGATAGTAWSITFILRQDGTGSRTVTWPSGTDWAAATAPTLTTTASGVDVVTLLTVDGGTTWLGFLGGKAFG
jgi:hypothetical protein